ncbi:MAG: hypothetical protein HOM11_01550 [Methylococcales bacterium]|jgi:predicted aspartyl protease|nr:hypothetical protein [Methylococcales bacterium]MBT7442524.1 hypothetical protein [Methylococcales bacterium]
MKRHGSPFFLSVVVLLLCAMPASARDFVALEDTGAGTYYLPGYIDQVGPVKWLLDTGSGYPVISYDALSALLSSRGTRYIRNITAVMADERRRLVPIYRISQMRLGTSCVLKDVEVAVFPNVRRNIIGMRALKQLAPFEISIEPLGIYLSHCNGR